MEYIGSKRELLIRILKMIGIIQVLDILFLSFTLLYQISEI